MARGNFISSCRYRHGRKRRQGSPGKIETLLTAQCFIESLLDADIVDTQYGNNDRCEYVPLKRSIVGHI